MAFISNESPGTFQSRPRSKHSGHSHGPPGLSRFPTHFPWDSTQVHYGGATRQFPGRGRQLRNRFRALGCASCPISEDLGGCHFRQYSSPPQLLCKGCSGNRWGRGRFVNLHTGPCQPPSPPSLPKLGPKGLPLVATPQGQATSPCSLAHEGNRDCCVDTGRPQTTGESSWTKESEKGLAL